MTKKIFYVFGGGDNEVGVGDTESKITIEDNLLNDDNDNDVKNWKDFLCEYYDLDIKNVLTEKEFIKEQESKELDTELLGYQTTEQKKKAELLKETHNKEVTKIISQERDKRQEELNKLLFKQEELQADKNITKICKEVLK